MDRTDLPALVLALVAILALQLGSMAALAAPLHTMTLEGILVSDRGTPLSGAIIQIAGRTAQTRADGTYQLQMPQPAGQQPALAWAPGYREMHTVVSFPPADEQLDNVTLNFSGQFALVSAFVDPATGSKLDGLPVSTPAQKLVAHLHGTTSVALEPKIAVTLPSGRVHMYGIHRSGAAFTANVPFAGAGVYRVEVNAASGLALFNVLVFHGVAASLPADPSFPADPASANQQQMRQFAVQLLNQVRSGTGLAPVKLDTRVTQAATAHNDEMARMQYVFVHPHTGANGSTPWDRVRATDPTVRAVAETVAQSFSIGAGLDGLLDSPGHRAIILGHFRWVGIGVTAAPGGVLLTIDWAR